MPNAAETGLVQVVKLAPKSVAVISPGSRSWPNSGQRGMKTRVEIRDLGLAMIVLGQVSGMIFFVKLKHFNDFLKKLIRQIEALEFLPFCC